MQYENANERTMKPKKKLRPRLRAFYPYDYNDVKEHGDTYRVALGYQYVSEALKDDFLNWNIDQSVMITAATGMGKNYFIENILIPYALASGKRILLFSNRVALGRQEKRRLAKIFDEEWKLDEYTDIGLDRCTEFGCVTAVSYQQLECWVNYNSAELRMLRQKKFDYVIVDEAHYFLSDAAFNAFTDISFRYICEEFQTSIRVYLTATPYEIFPVLKKRDCFIGKDEKSGEKYYSPRNWLLYEFESDFSWINPFAFDDKEDIIDIIRRSKEKWLVFVNSIDDGKVMREALGEGVFLTAESKNYGDDFYPQYRQIVEEERCDQRVLFTTAVLENGINIKDYYAKNIVIFSNDKVQFMQMLGRIRRYPGSKINLYISNIDTETVINCKLQINNTITAIKNYRANPTDFYVKYIAQNSPRAKMSGAFTILQNGDSHLNGLLMIKAEYYDILLWSSLGDRIKSGEHYAVLEEKFSWIGKEFCQESYAGRKQYEEALRGLLDFLEAQQNIKIKDEEKYSFSEQFSKFARKVFGKRKNEKGSKTYGLATIKKILTEQDLPYLIEGKRDGWYITKKESHI